MQIHWAAKRGDEREVERYLRNGVPVDSVAARIGGTPLLWAARSRHAGAAMLRLLVDAGADVNAVSGKPPETVLYAAAHCGSLGKVRLLIEAGADPRSGPASDAPALVGAIYRGGPEALPLVQFLLDAGADVDDASSYGESGVRTASDFGRFDVVRVLLDRGADPTPLRWTGLMHAIALAALDEVRALLDAGADLSAVDHTQRTPFLLAICAGDTDKIEALLARGARLTETGAQGATALMHAAACDQPAMCRWLVEHGAAVDARDAWQHTALMLAAEHRAPGCVEVLTQAGADVHAENHVQETALTRARDAATVRMLARAGADIDLVGGQGFSVLESAAEDGNEELVRELLALGASPHATSTGRTALHAAAGSDELGIVAMLIEAGADPNATDVDGYTPLMYAQTPHCVEMLVRAGARTEPINDGGETALSGAEDPELIEALLRAGASVRQDRDSTPVLRHSAERNDANGLRTLIAAGADVNAATSWGETALMAAAERSHAEAVEALLEAGADVYRRDEDGRTALFRAAAPEGFTAYKLMQEHASPKWRESLMESIRMDLPDGMEMPDLGALPPSTYGYVESDSVRVIELLVAAGADIDAKDRRRMTPLMLAAACGRPARVHALLARGADRSRRDRRLRRAIDHARKHPDPEQRRQIIEALRAP